MDFFESKLVNYWVRFLVGLLVFKQVVNGMMERRANATRQEVQDI